MAALTSTKSGPFTGSATWGGSTPADGDTFTIAAGHSVTCSTVDMPTNGYGDITVHGCLSFQSGSQFKLNGRATIYGGESNYFTEGESDSAGKFEMKPDTHLILKGTNSEQHAVWCETQTRAQVICDGDEATLNTVISCSNYIDYNQDYLPVVSASNFAAGDWISVYSRGQGYKNCSDESFFVHDVDTTAGLNKIYYRQFVSPTATIQGFNGTRVIRVDNAKVFRVGYKIIFGTGSDRNVVSIVGIDFLRNFIRIDANVSGTITNLIGKTIYQTGNEKPHTSGFGKDLHTDTSPAANQLFPASGSQVRRNATTLTTAIESADSTADIVVGNASDLSVGDVILIDVNNDTDTNWDYDTRYTINAIDGTTLTLDDQVRYVHKVGSLVTKVTRNCRITSEDADDRVFIYVEVWTAGSGGAFTRRIRFRNVEFSGLGGNTNSNYYRAGVCISGYNGGLDPNNTGDALNYGFQSEITNCVYDGSQCNSTETYRGFYIRQSWGLHFRNNICYTSDRGIFAHSYGGHAQYMGNYSTRAAYTTFFLDNHYENYAEASYNYITRSDDYGMLCYHLRENVPRRHWIVLNHENRAFYHFYACSNQLWDRMHIDGFRYWPFLGEANGDSLFLDSYIKNRWDCTSPDGSGTVYSNYILMGGPARVEWDRTTGKYGMGIYQEYNHEIDGLAMQGGQCLREWINDGGYWKVKFGDDSAAGAMDTVYVPPGVTVRLSCEVQSNGTDGNFNYPHLTARKSGDWKRGRYRFGEYDTTNFTSTTVPRMLKGNSFYENVQYTNASIGNFENKTLTIQPQQVGYYLVYGVRVDSTNTREENFFMKDPVVRFDKAGSAEVRLDRNTNRKTVVRSNFTTIKKRISGRI
jgi:hypothetical protein